MDREVPWDPIDPLKGAETFALLKDLGIEKVYSNFGNCVKISNVDFFESRFFYAKNFFTPKNFFGIFVKKSAHFPYFRPVGEK